jgi:exopolysaccharide biosynthesis polyprenyl glycosylphosphotransferase
LAAYLATSYLAPTPSEYLRVFLLAAPATVLCIEVLGGHRPIRNQPPVQILLCGILSSLVGFALLSTGLSRPIVFTLTGMSCVAICLPRFVGRAWFSYRLREGMYAEEIAIIAKPAAAKLIAAGLARSRSQSEYRLMGYFPLLEDAEQCVQLETLGEVEDLDRVLIHVAIQRVIMVVPESWSPWLDQAIKTCDYFRVTAEIVPEAVLNASLADLVPQTNLTLAPSEAESDWLYLKRVLDISVSGILMILLAPVFLLIAIAIKVTTPRLPVFYPWHVVGYRGRRFTGYKFTTMVADAEERCAQLADLNEMTGPVFKIAKDPRVTPLGRFLRKYSLNEFPQLWSVFKGDMSLVGPRPAGPSELERYELWQKRKLSAQPGITCFWQVRGRNRISNFDDWVRMDLEYIRDRSLWIDCKILARTAWVVVRGTGS